MRTKIHLSMLVCGLFDILLYEIKRVKLNWHYHKEEFAPNRADPKLQMLNEQQQNATMKSLAESYGKVIITWNPNDKA
jgi:hypothetical protein